MIGGLPASSTMATTVTSLMKKSVLRNEGGQCIFNNPTRWRN